MKILDIIRCDDNIYIFTDDIKKDIKTFKRRHKHNYSKLNLWYDSPEIINYSFLWKDYECILLRYDYEFDVAKESEIEIRDFYNINK